MIRVLAICCTYVAVVMAIFAWQNRPVRPIVTNPSPEPTIIVLVPSEDGGFEVVTNPEQTTEPAAPAENDRRDRENTDEPEVVVVRNDDRPQNTPSRREQREEPRQERDEEPREEPKRRQPKPDKEPEPPKPTEEPTDEPEEPEPLIPEELCVVESSGPLVDIQLEAC